MTTEFNITGKIQNIDNQEMLQALIFLKDTFTAYIKYAQAMGDTKEIMFSLVAIPTMNDATDYIASLIAEFGDGERLTDWNLTYQNTGG